jgi:TonB-linked SusC/RagA family outer membrane protein
MIIKTTSKLICKKNTRMIKKVTTLILAIFTSAVAFAQVKTISGKVIDQESGLALPGATITKSKGNVSTAADGTFLIKANTGERLTVSYTGFVTKEVVVGNNLNLLIGLTEDPKSLSEVVVTGALGIKRSAREMGSSAQLVSNESLNQGKTVNPLFGLSSKVAGLRINMYDSKVDPVAQITLRGTRSLSRSTGIDGRNTNAPIYVVDGMPVPNINRLNPNDIESITVLKGANAAALYGSEGVNGALMITTKNGARGSNVVNVSNTTTFSNAFLLPNAQTTYGQGVNGAYDPVQYASWGPKFDGSMKDIGLPLPDGTQPQLLYAAPGKDNRLGLFQTGINVQNDVSFSGGDQNSTYFLSAQYVTQTGIIPKDKNDRIGLRFNGSRNFNKLKTSYNINYIHNKKSITPDGPWIGAYSMPANLDFSRLKNWEDVNSMASPHNYFTPETGNLRNPYFQIDNIRDNSTQQILNGKVDLDYEFTPWFSALYRIGIYSISDEIRTSTNKFEAAGTRNVQGSVNDANNNYRRLNSDLILNFKKDFGDFSTKLLLGQNTRTDYKKENNISANNLLYTDLLNPGSRQGELGGAVAITQQRSMAVYGEFVAGYKNYLFLTFTGRNDWVSTLSKENRSFFYPGVSTSFIASDAIQSIKNSNTISFAKVYASWNRTGNVTLQPYSLENAYAQSNGFPFGNSVGYLPSLSVTAPGIQPEFVSSYEAGIQFGLFNNRLNFDGAYVYSDSDGQIFNSTASRATGYNVKIINAGRLVNNIFELSLNGDIIRSNEVKWNMGINFTYIKNTVKDLSEGLTNINNFRQSYAVKGEQYPSLLVSDYAKDPQGRVIIDANGEPMKAQGTTNLGSLIPPYLMGLSTGVSYKGFSLNAQLDWRMGGWLYSEIVPRMYSAGTHPATVQYDRQPFVWPNSVIETAPGIYVENTNRLSKGDQAFWTKQGEIQINTAAKSDFLKLRELSLNYAVPAKFLAGQKVIRQASLGLVANNVFIIRHKDNDMGDPEYLYNNTDGYISFRQVPPMRTFGFNVNLTF